jgi:hypothetical protein
MGVVYTEMGKKDLAVQSYNRVIQMEPNGPQGQQAQRALETLKTAP